MLVFRSNILNENSYDNSDVYSDSPSTSSTCFELSKIENNDKASMPFTNSTECAIPENGSFNSSNGDKKKSLSMSSSFSNNSNEHLERNFKCYGENKENLMFDRDDMPASIYNITFKFLNTETRLLRKILLGHGLTEATHDANDYNLLWTGNVLKPDLLRSLSSYQRINHFPR